MGPDTLVDLAALVGVSVSILGYLHAIKRDLLAEVGACRSELKGEIQACRSELKSEIQACRSGLEADVADVKSDIARLDGRLTTIEQRTYDLSTRLPARPA